MPSSNGIARCLIYALAVLVIPGVLTAGSFMPAVAATRVTTPIAQGKLTSADGVAVAGQRIYLYAWPGSSTLERLHNGSTVPVRKVSVAITSASGAYAIDAPPVPAGTNLQVVTAGAAYSFTSHGAGAVRTVSLRLRVGVPEQLASPTVPAVCNSPTLVRSYGPRSTVVGATYSKVSGVSMSFTYGYGQSSDLGVGFSGSGTNGTFSADGTASVSSDSSEDFPPSRNVASRVYRTEFVYKEYRQICSLGINFYAEPTSFAGGATTSRTSAPRAGYCVPFAAHSTFHKRTSSAYTWGGGVSITAILGINLSSHTGYNSSAEVTYAFSKRRQLCGTNGYPGGTPKRLVAQ